MIDTRLCKSKKELELAMTYEHNKTLLSQIKSHIFKIQIEKNNLECLLTQKKEKEKQLEKDIKLFEKRYGYMIKK